MYSFFPLSDEERSYQPFKSRLGKESQLGISFRLLNKNGHVIAKESYNETLAMPMASIKKIAIALAVLKAIFDDGQMRLSDEVKIKEEDYCPGLPWNILDRYWFIPSLFNPKNIYTVEELLINMLTKSDNTSSDKLIELIGGVNTINDLMKELGIESYNITRTSKQLLQAVYGVSGEKSILNALNMLYKMKTSGFSLQENEKTIYSNNEDSSTPEAIAKLLKLLVISREKDEENWLSQAAKIICGIMEDCETGIESIKEGLKDCKDMEKIGNKTGSIGSVVNDAAFIKFENGECAILSIFTCFSSLEDKLPREKVIADITKFLISKHHNINNLMECNAGKIEIRL